MLSLLLPPIIIVVAAAILVWIFLRKKPEADRLFLENFLRRRNRTKESTSHLGPAESLSARIARRRYGIASVFQKGKKAVLDGVKFDMKPRVLQDPELQSQREKMLSFGKQFLKRETISADETVDTQEVEEDLKEVVKVVAEQDPVPQNKSVFSEKSQFEDILVERIAMNPRDIEAYERLGDYYLEQEIYSDAKECYKQVLRLSPVNRKAKIRMRKLEKILGGKM